MVSDDFENLNLYRTTAGASPQPPRKHHKIAEPSIERASMEKISIELTSQQYGSIMMAYKEDSQHAGVRRSYNYGLLDKAEAGTSHGSPLNFVVQGEH